VNLRSEVVLLQLPALPQVPGADGVVQAPSPQFCAIVGDVYAAGPIRVALELPRNAKQGGRVNIKKARPIREAARTSQGPSHTHSEVLPWARPPGERGVTPDSESSR
jgi:hypothetical protein